MRFLLLITRLGFILGLTGLSFLAISAFLGFAHPLLDALNHLQPLLFMGTLLALLVSLIFFNSHRWGGGVLALASTGFLASAVIVIPELVSSWVDRSPLSTDQSTIRIMSHNLFGMNSEMVQVAEAIATENPDILAFQEYFEGQWSLLHPLIVKDYPYFLRCAGGRRAFIAVYAKIPFELTPATTCPPNDISGGSDVARIAARFDVAGEQSFTVVTTHLNWPIQISPLFNNSLDFPERLTGTYARQNGEMDELAAAVRRTDGPVVLVGDFNSTPWSHALRRFTSQSGLQRHTKNMFTYPTTFYMGRWVPTQPFLPLDHLMSSDRIKVYKVKAGSAAGSDHLPLIADFSVGEPS